MKNEKYYKYFEKEGKNSWQKAKKILYYISALMKKPFRLNFACLSISRRSTERKDELPVKKSIDNAF